MLYCYVSKRGGCLSRVERSGGLCGISSRTCATYRLLEKLLLALFAICSRLLDNSRGSGATYSHTECATKVGQRNPGAGISRVIHCGRCRGLGADVRPGCGATRGAIERGRGAQKQEQRPEGRVARRERRDGRGWRCRRSVALSGFGWQVFVMMSPARKSWSSSRPARDLGHSAILRIFLVQGLPWLIFATVTARDNILKIDV